MIMNRVPSYNSKLTDRLHEQGLRILPLEITAASSVRRYSGKPGRRQAVTAKSIIITYPSTPLTTPPTTLLKNPSIPHHQKTPLRSPPHLLPQHPRRRPLTTPRKIPIIPITIKLRFARESVAFSLFSPNQKKYAVIFNSGVYTGEKNTTSVSTPAMHHRPQFK
jgi:hypothetical protein